LIYTGLPVVHLVAEGTGTTAFLGRLRKG